MFLINQEINQNLQCFNQKHFQKLYTLPYNNSETCHFQMFWKWKSVSFYSALHQPGPQLEIITKITASTEKTQQPQSLRQDSKQCQVFLNFRRTWGMLTHKHSTAYKRCTSPWLCKGQCSHTHGWQSVWTLTVHSASQPSPSALKQVWS